MQQRKTTSPWVYVLRFIFTLCLICTVVFIFKNSMESGQFSSIRSEQVMEFINAVLGKVGLGPLSHHAVRKLAHFTEYAMLGFWFMLCLRVYTTHFVRHMSWPLFVCLLTANVDETLQTFVSGRAGQLKDVWIDFAGVLCGTAVSLFILLFVRMCGILWRESRKERYVYDT